jgi:hypothetical protein
MREDQMKGEKREPAWKVLQKKWYNSARWKITRAAQLRAEPFCRMCTRRGRLGVTASVADHVVPPKGDWYLFWNGELQSLCKTDHSQMKQQEERTGFSVEVGVDGTPLDPNHPWHRRDRG